MMTPLEQRAGVLLLAPFLALVLLPCAARAQGDLPSTPPPPPAPPRGKPAGPRVVTKTAYVKTTSVTVIAEPNAHVTLTPLRRPASSKAGVVSADKRTVTFYDLPPGRYVVRAELDGHRPDEETFVVAAHRAHDVELSLPPITYDVTLSLNAPSGLVMYSRDDGPPLVATLRNGTALLPGLERGSYVVKVEPEDATYGPLQTVIVVPSQDNKFSRTLERRETTREFAGRSASDWKLPDGWRVNSLKLSAGGRGLALPSNDDFHYYTDFQLSTNARMINGVAVSLAVRVKDPKNYYLIQLTGRNADEPYVVRGFIVKDDVPQPLGGASPIRHLAETIKPGKDFHLLLTMKGSDINLSVEDSETGETITLGILSDSGNIFRIGAVGVVARAGEEFEVESFTVCTPVCRK